MFAAFDDFSSCTYIAKKMGEMKKIFAIFVLIFKCLLFQTKMFIVHLYTCSDHLISNTWIFRMFTVIQYYWNLITNNFEHRQGLCLSFIFVKVDAKKMKTKNLVFWGKEHLMFYLLFFIETKCLSWKKNHFSLIMFFAHITPIAFIPLLKFIFIFWTLIPRYSG